MTDNKVKTLDEQLAETPRPPAMLSINDLDIVGVAEEDGVLYSYIRSYVLAEDVEDVTVLLVVDEVTLGNMLQAWLHRKHQICKHYDHFCGVGYISICNYEVLDEKINLLDTDQETYKDVPVLLVDFMERVEDVDVDMEHG